MSDTRVLDKNSNAILKTIWALTMICGIIVFGLYNFLNIKNAGLLIMGIKIMITIIVFLMIVAIFMGFALWRLRKTMQGSKTFKMLYRYLHVLYPFLYGVGKLLKMEKSEIRKSYIANNNKLVHLLFNKFAVSDALILTPHCLQNSDCNIKVTGSSNHCIKCGKCDIKGLVELSEKYNIPLVVATGGTLARKAIEDLRPKIIFAVACDRDLAAGIYDIQTIPVVGILNKRPNGPCFNTSIDIEEIENEILALTKNTSDAC